MKLVIFAGGKGTRLWPLSRVNSPKQFDKIFNNKSTLRLAFERIEPVFGVENIFIQTIDRYKDIVKEQIPELKEENIFIEPAKRDVGPAVCFAANELSKKGYSGAISILWSDHIMERVDNYVNALKIGEELIRKNPERIIWLGEQPRFANDNIGWIKVDESKEVINNFSIYNFSGWKYRPEAKECDKIYKSGFYLWNSGYFITSIKFLIDSYKKLTPEIYDKVVGGDYENAPAISFDVAIAEKLSLDKAVVIKTNMGWTDPGTLYALKKALEEAQKENVIEGKVSTLNCEDSLIYNLEDKKLVAAVGLRGMVVVNTDDALIVVHKDEVVHITKLVKQMEEEGFNKYL